jgi:hypothetical protein
MEPNKISLDYFRKVENEMKKNYFNLQTMLEKITTSEPGGKGLE